MKTFKEMRTPVKVLENLIGHGPIPAQRDEGELVWEREDKADYLVAVHKLEDEHNLYVRFVSTHKDFDAARAHAKSLEKKYHAKQKGHFADQDAVGFEVVLIKNFLCPVKVYHELYNRRKYSTVREGLTVHYPMHEQVEHCLIVSRQETPTKIRAKMLGVYAEWKDADDARKKYLSDNVTDFNQYTVLPFLNLINKKRLLNHLGYFYEEEKDEDLEAVAS